jgi:tetratricopeptide (TPR) repeat protein
MRKKTTRKDEMLKDNQFGRLLESLQVRQGWRQDDAAAHLGFSLRTYSDWVTGKNLPFSEQLQHIAATFKLDTAAKAELYLAAAQSAPKIHNLPFRRNPLFTGRKNCLELVADYFKANTAVTLSGLPGIGKTQLALEYAHRCYQDGVYQAVFWVDAANETTLVSSYDKLAHKLKLPDLDERDLGKSVEAVKEWLEIHTHWLLIMDNADNLLLARSFFPEAQQAKAHQGRILLTTRSQIVGDVVATQIEIDKMEPAEGLRFLLRRTHKLEGDAMPDAVAADMREAAAQVVELLDGHPLALDQAGAFVEDGGSFTEYRQLYDKQRRDLLDRRGSLKGADCDYPETVAVTFALCFNKAREQHHLAGDILHFCAFLHPDNIPDELFRHDDSFKSDTTALIDGRTALLRYSLIKRNDQERTISLHRLVQAVLIDTMPPDLIKQWRERVVLALSAAFPDEVEFKNWRQCERMLSHALACATWTEVDLTPTVGVARLFHNASIYLYGQELYSVAVKLMARVLSIHKQHFEVEHPNTVSVLHDLAGLYFHQGNYERAEPLYQQALSIREKQLGAEHPDTVSSLHNLAVLYTKQGKYEQAEALLVRVLSIQEDQLGAEHPDTVISLHNLACLYVEQVKYEEAEQLLKRVFSIREKQLGAEHPNTVNSLYTLAILYYKQGKYRQAELLHRRALSLWEKHLGAEHPEIAIPLYELAEILYAQGQYDQAEALCKRALHIHQRPLGTAYPRIYGIEVAYAYVHSIGRDAEAAALTVNDEPSV